MHLTIPALYLYSCGVLPVCQSAKSVPVVLIVTNSMSG